MQLKLKILCLAILVMQNYAFPETITDKNSFIVRTSEDIQHDSPYQNDKEQSPTNFVRLPKIYQMRIDSDVTNRFAHTLVTSKVKNDGSKAQEAVFSIVLPKKAFISKFVMSIGGKDYNAYVKEKDEAKKIYEQAVYSGQGAGLVSANARDSNRFTVSVNIEPNSKVTFLLTYEELLERNDNRYELVINIHPKQPVNDLTVHVNINESRPLAFVTAPPIRSGNEISKVYGDLDPRAQISQIDSNSSIIKFSPNEERQKELANTLGTNVDEGLSGQFVVQYDVERNPNGGEILLQDGYFVHFFAPPHVKPLKKYVLFVLDTSGSMYGTKINQLREAMKSILSELRNEDKFHLIDFNTLVKVLDLDNPSGNVQYPSNEPSFYDDMQDQEPEDISLKRFPNGYDVSPDNIEKAGELVDNMTADGGTNIGDSLKVALYLVEEYKRNNPQENSPQPMIIFLTDGDATVGVTDARKILSQVEEQNKYSTPIFSLSFGAGADRDLLQKLSLRNNGFARHIYEAADATLQLQDFYKHISSPILNNVTFKYVDDAKEVTKTNFPILFEGSELVVVGKLDNEFNKLPTITGQGFEGNIELTPEVRRPVTRLERLWAYLTIQQLLDDIERSDNKTLVEQKALDLALKYSFVTPVSSLVVVKPNGTDSSVQPQSADKESDFPDGSLGIPLSAAFPESLLEEMEPVYESLASPSTEAQSPEKYAPSSTFIPPVTSVIEVLKHNLPWLENLLVGDVISSTDGTYKLGLNETSTENVVCPASPKNGPGLCKLLHECPQVHYLLTNIYIFQQYYCEMRGFAAVCCPSVPAN